MLELKIDQAKKFFFDRAKIERGIEKMAFRGVFKQAMLIKSIAQRSMRSGGKKGKRSAPNEPPRTHGQRLLRTQLFGVMDPQSRSAVIGPALINGKARGNRGQTVPQTLEFGGDVDMIECLMPDGSWKPAFTLSPKQAAFSQKRTGTGHVKPRPYMAPAEKIGRAKFAEQFRNQFGRAA